MKLCLENNFFAPMPGLALYRFEYTGLAKLSTKTTDSSALFDVIAQVFDNIVYVSVKKIHSKHGGTKAEKSDLILMKKRNVHYVHEGAEKGVLFPFHTPSRGISAIRRTEIKAYIHFLKIQLFISE